MSHPQLLQKPFITLMFMCHDIIGLLRTLDPLDLGPSNPPELSQHDFLSRQSCALIIYAKRESVEHKVCKGEFLYSCIRNVLCSSLKQQNSYSKPE